MRVGTKLTMVTVTGVLAVLAVHGYERIRRETDLLADDMKRDHRMLARGLSLAAQVVADRSGVDDAIALLTEANEREPRMTLSWAAPGNPARASASGPSSRQVTDDGQEWLVTTVPLPLRGTPGELRLRESMTQSMSDIGMSVNRIAVVMAELALLCVIVLVGSTIMFVTRPLRTLMARVRRIGEGHLSDPPVLRQRDELGLLARELDAMCSQLVAARTNLEAETRQRVAAVEQMRHADRLSTVGRLASGVAHELGTPLNVVLAHARSIAHASTGDAATSDAQVIVAQSERMAAIIRQLLDLARPHTPRRQLADVGELVGEALAVLEPIASKRSVRLRAEPSPGPIVAEVDVGQIRQVISNLVINAIQAQSAGGEVRVRTSLTGGEVLIRVEDDGEGIPAEGRSRVFEPFFTTKSPGEGTGLGLTVSHDIVREHGGRIDVVSAEGQGSAFTVFLPTGPALAS